jgi:hypothetical protein
MTAGMSSGLARTRATRLKIRSGTANASAMKRGRITGSSVSRCCAPEYRLVVTRPSGPHSTGQSRCFWGMVTTLTASKRVWAETVHDKARETVLAGCSPTPSCDLPGKIRHLVADGPKKDRLEDVAHSRSLVPDSGSDSEVATTAQEAPERETLLPANLSRGNEGGSPTAPF